MKQAIYDNTNEQRFELTVDGKTAFIDYIINKKGVIYLTHTEVPAKLEGEGIGSRLVKQSLETIEQRELKLAPICPFVAAFIRRHPQWKKLLTDNFNA